MRQYWACEVVSVRETDGMGALRISSLVLASVLAASVLAATLLAPGCAVDEVSIGDGEGEGAVSERDARRFQRLGLSTDVSKHSVDLGQLLGGGPPKDGIPALTDPKMVSVEVADAAQADSTQGLLVEVGGERRFYPFSILVWHEIVNDSIGETHFAATF